MSRARPRLLHESGMVQALAAPLAVERVTAALARQPELRLPAKLVLTESGRGGILAEIPRTDDREVCEARVYEAAESALLWLEDEALLPSPPEAPVDRPGIEHVLAQLGWTWEAVDDAYRIHAAAEALACTVEVVASEGGVQVSTARTGLKMDNARALRAAQRFGLELSRRLVQSRVSVAPSVEGHARVVWDAFLPAGLPVERTLESAIEAVVSARLLSARPLHALGQWHVAEAFLGLRARKSTARAGKTINLPAPVPAI